MSSKRDLVEAHSYNRRRLITAFVSGAPGGREVEPVRHGRTLIGGAVLAVFVVVGALVSGFIGQPVPDNWAERGIIVGKDSGTRYFANKDTLYPVLNYTSALLLLGGEDDGNATTVSEKDIASKPKGETLGIAGAPEALPAKTDLVQTGWTACANTDGGVRVTISPRQVSTALSNDALLVTSGGEEYVIAGGRRYAVPTDSSRTTVTRALGVDGQIAADVPGSWLDLVPVGTPLAVPSVPGAGEQVKTAATGLDTVGTPVLVDGQPRVLGRNGELTVFSPLAFRLYTASGVQAKRVSLADVSDVRTNNQSQPYPSDWPTAVPTAYAEPRTPCLRMTMAAQQKPTITLAGPRTSAVLASAGSVTRTVSNGRGALVRGVTGSILDEGNVYLVDGTGTAYVVGGSDPDKTQQSLRLGDVDPVPVPRPWIDVLASGPELSPTAASRPAVSAVGQTS